MFEAAFRLQRMLDRIDGTMGQNGDGDGPRRERRRGRFGRVRTFGRMHLAPPVITFT